MRVKLQSSGIFNCPHSVPKHLRVVLLSKGLLGVQDGEQKHFILF